MDIRGFASMFGLGNTANLDKQWQQDEMKRRQRNSPGVTGAIKDSAADTVDFAKSIFKPGLELGSYAAPVGKGLNFITSELARGAASGAASTKASNPIQAVKDIATSAAGSLATGGALKGVGVIANKVADNAMSNLFREPTKKAITSAIKKGDELGKKVAESTNGLGKGLTEEGIHQNALKVIGDLENHLQEGLNNSKAKISIPYLTEKLQPRISELNNAGENSAANGITNRLAAWQKIHGDEIPVAMANKIKRTLYDKINNSYGKLAAEGTEDVKATARALKESISEKVPGIDEINKALSDNGRVAEAMVSKMAKSSAPNLIDATLGAGGFAAGGLPGLLLPVANRVMQSPAGQKATAAVARGVNKVANNPVVNKVVNTAGSQATQGMANLFMGNGVTNDPNSQPQQDPTNNSQHGEIIPQDEQMNNSTTTSDGMVTIVNKKTGEERKVKSSELGQYGVSQGGAGSTDPADKMAKMLPMMMQYDLQKTGGKHLTQLKSLLDANLAQKKYELDVQKANKSKTDKPLTAAAQKDVNKAQTGLKALDRISGDIAKDPDVLLKTMNPLDQSGRKLDADMRSVIDLIGYFRTGATITPEQRKDYMSMFPSALDDTATRKRKMDAIQSELEGYRNIQPDTPDMPDFSALFAGAGGQ